MILGDIIRFSQHCCARERTIMDAGACIHDFVAYAVQTYAGYAFYV